MNVERAIDIVYEGLVGEESIPVDLRMGRGLDYNKLVKVKKALKILIEFYRDKKDVPKKLACCFIDIYGLFQFKKEYYPKEELIEFDYIGVELQELAWILLVPNN